VNLRHPLDFLAEPRTLPKALRMNPDEIGGGLRSFSRAHIVVYVHLSERGKRGEGGEQLRELGVERGASAAEAGGLGEDAGFQWSGTWR